MRGCNEETYKTHGLREYTSAKKMSISRMENLFVPASAEESHTHRGTNIALCCTFSIPVDHPGPSRRSDSDSLLSADDVEIALRRACARHFRLCSTLNPVHVRQPMQISSKYSSEIPLNLRCFEIKGMYIRDWYKIMMACIDNWKFTLNIIGRNPSPFVDELFLYEVNTINPLIAKLRNDAYLPWRATVLIGKVQNCTD